jgi:hypothetical protein
MSWATFLTALLETGRVRVGLADLPAEHSIAEADETLRTFDAVARLEMADDAPDFRLEAARWGASTLYRACQLLVFRDLDQAAVKHGLSRPCPGTIDPATIYSVDLTLRWLPDLLTLARAAAIRDVLVEELLRLAREWPLSSVGIKDLEGIEPGAIIEHASLLQLYVDRVIARRDKSRLVHPAVVRGVRRALGMFPELCPELAAVCEEQVM